MKGYPKPRAIVGGHYDGEARTVLHGYLLRLPAKVPLTPQHGAPTLNDYCVEYRPFYFMHGGEKRSCWVPSDWTDRYAFDEVMRR